MEFADLIYHRYASPTTLLNEVIAAGQLSEFIHLVIKKREEERDWEYYLHRVLDKSFNDFVNEMETETQTRQTIDVETTLQDSISMMTDFSPEE